MVSVAGSGCRTTPDLSVVLFEAAPVTLAGSKYLFVDSNDRGHARKQPLAAAAKQFTALAAAFRRIAVGAFVPASGVSE